MSKTAIWYVPLTSKEIHSIIRALHAISYVMTAEIRKSCGRDPQELIELLESYLQHEKLVSGDDEE